MKASDPIKRLSDIKSEIDALKREAHAIIESLKSSFDSSLSSSAPAAPVKRRGRKPAAEAASVGEEAPRKRRGSPLKGRKRPASPSGPLAPAVVDVLRKAGQPLNVAGIYDALVAANYVFTSSDAKKNLAARVYKLPGVKVLGDGMFGLDEAAAS